MSQFSTVIALLVPSVPPREKATNDRLASGSCIHNMTQKVTGEGNLYLLHPWGCGQTCILQHSTVHVTTYYLSCYNYLGIFRPLQHHVIHVPQHVKYVTNTYRVLQHAYSFNNILLLYIVWVSTYIHTSRINVRVIGGIVFFVSTATLSSVSIVSCCTVCVLRGWVGQWVARKWHLMITLLSLFFQASVQVIRYMLVGWLRHSQSFQHVVMATCCHGYMLYSSLVLW